MLIILNKKQKDVTSMIVIYFYINANYAILPKLLILRI